MADLGTFTVIFLPETDQYKSIDNALFSYTSVNSVILIPEQVDTNINIDSDTWS